MGLSATSPTSLSWVFLRHHKHLCHITGLIATSPRPLSYYEYSATSCYGCFCEITNISVILWVFLRHQITSRQYYGSFCDIRNIFAVVWPFLRHQKDLCDIMNACVVLWIFVQHQKHLCVTQNEMYLCTSLCTLHVLACLHTASTAFRHLPPNSEHRFPAPSSKLRAPLSGTFLQTLPDLVTPLKGHSLSPRSCPATRSAPSERFRY